MEAEERTHTSVEGKTQEMRCNLGEREFNLPLIRGKDASYRETRE